MKKSSLKKTKNKTFRLWPKQGFQHFRLRPADKSAYTPPELFRLSRHHQPTAPAPLPEEKPRKPLPDSCAVLPAKGWSAPELSELCAKTRQIPAPLFLGPDHGKVPRPDYIHAGANQLASSARAISDPAGTEHETQRLAAKKTATMFHAQAGRKICRPESTPAIARYNRHKKPRASTGEAFPDKIHKFRLWAKVKDRLDKQKQLKEKVPQDKQGITAL